MEGIGVKVWITKYALSKGIFEAEAESSFTPRMAKITSPNWPKWPYFHGEEWHTTKEAAVKKAEKMRLARIESLKKQIAKLEKMKFE